MRTKNKTHIRYTALWKSIKQYHGNSYPKFNSLFQSESAVLCKNTFDSPTLLILNDLSRSKIYEYSLDTNTLKNFNIIKYNDSTNYNRPFGYYAVTEEINKSIFIFGGMTASKRGNMKFSNKLYRLSLSNRTLLEVDVINKDEQPAARVGATLTYVSVPYPHLLMFGGVTESGKFKNDIWVFNILKLRWDIIDTSGEIPPPMELHSAKLWKKFLIVTGGLIKDGTKFNTLDDIYWLDLENVEWHCHSGSNLVNRANHTMHVLNEEILIFGGFQILKNNKSFKNMKFDRDNYVAFHENLIEKSKILDSMNIINMDSLDIEIIDDDETSIIMTPITGHSSFLYGNIFGIFGGTALDLENEELYNNENFYICELGSPPSPYHAIPYNINCSSFDLVWKESCSLKQLEMNRTYSVEIMKLSNDSDLEAIDGMQIAYTGRRSKCHINRIIYNEKYSTPLYPDTNYKVRLYSYTKYNDFERFNFPETVIRTAPCDIIALPVPNYYFLETENLFIINWVNENYNKFPCVHTKYYVSAIPIYIEKSENNNKYIMDLNSSILYIGLNREISFTIDQLIKSLKKQSKFFESTEDKSIFHVIIKIDQYNLIHDNIIRFDTKQVMITISNYEFESFMCDEELLNFLAKHEIEKFGDSNSLSGSELKVEPIDNPQDTPSTRNTRSTRSTRSSTRSATTSSKRKRNNMNSEMYSSLRSNNNNSLDSVIELDLITKNKEKSKSLKNTFKDEGEVFNIKLFKNNYMMKIEYEYFDKSTIKERKKTYNEEEDENDDYNYVQNDEETYDKYDNYFNKTLEKPSKKFKASYTEEEVAKYSNYYTKDNISKYKDNYYNYINRKRKENYERPKKEYDDKYQSKIVCFNTHNGREYLTTSINELYFTGDIIIQDEDCPIELTNSEKRAILTLMKYNKNFIFQYYSPSKNESSQYDTIFPDSLNSLISENTELNNINNLLSKIKEDDKCIKLAFLDNNITRYIICANDKNKRNPTDIALFFI
ncbi:hypothetical protein BCR32DRAFT_291089 [Anaeromyces robustus]|uniref:Galactose oxidase n=1 Tax=Anaeromyces robustus TaxID=1754192 RepID=A0A1Y1XGE6_9FUNG|nr:hypothetical protein BCR32DRAFT_291089 [Anaeromyces robustus]|eukprot:ORX84830.1 hypothetical protein BCR32DRAFT_291089 [Anaeromyces robustus]